MIQKKSAKENTKKMSQKGKINTKDNKMFNNS